MVSDCNSCDLDNNSKITIKIDDLFHSLESFLGVAEPNLLFAIDGINDSRTDFIKDIYNKNTCPRSLTDRIQTSGVWDGRSIRPEGTFINLSCLLNLV